MTNRSIKSRFSISIVSNGLRAGTTFITALVVARALGPHEYGSYAFLIGSFSAVKQLLDCGTSSAFYTFISQRPRGRTFFAVYAAWLALQFALPLAVIGLILPQSLISMLWVGHDQGIILFAFIAVFMQQQAWQAMVQVGESMRRTFFVQVLSLGVTLLHLAIVIVLWRARLLGVNVLFTLIIAEYFVATAAAIHYLPSPEPNASIGFSWRTTWREYRAYCSPLVLYSWVGFAYSYVDTWLLQRFGGAAEQAYYAVGFQFATGCLLASSAMLHIFWKEIAEAHKAGNLARVELLFHRVSRFLFMVSAAISGLLLPWSADIARFVLGPEFVAGGSVLAIMLLYPLHASLGQIVGTAFFATGRTTPQVVIGIAFMALSTPIAYVLLAPTDMALPGLDLGGMGMSLKMVSTTIVSSNVMAWWLARQKGWKFDWIYQVLTTGICLGSGWFACFAARLTQEALQLDFFTSFVFAAICHLVVLGAIVFFFPAMAGTTRDEIGTYLQKLGVRKFSANL